LPTDTPLVLSFDTSAAQCAAALLCGDTVLSRRIEPMKKGQAERLFPMLEEMLAEAEKGWPDLDRIAVCTGPGNFTGVRISVAAARGLALALDIPAIGVSTFEALAFGQTGALRVTLDGRRGQVFYQDFKEGVAVSEPDAASVETLGLTRSDTAQVGYLAGALAKETPFAPTVDPVVLARYAAKRHPDGRPAPLYLRAADAALPADPPPTIFP